MTTLRATGAAAIDARGTATTTPGLRVAAPPFVALALLLALLSVAGCSRVAAREEAAPTESSTLQASFRLATWNVRNLFDAADDPYTEDEETRPAPKPEPELAALAEAIREIDADVLAVVEVENRGVLERFVRERLRGMGYDEIALVEGNDPRGIDVAVVSRFPVETVTSHRNRRFDGPNPRGERFRRDLLRVEVRLEDGSALDVWVLHLKSRIGGAQAAEVRLAEAREARAILDRAIERDPGRMLAVLGDFNDDLESETLRILEGGGTGSLPSLLRRIPSDGRETWRGSSGSATLDHILVSRGLERRLRPGSVRILRTESVAGASDHRPIVADFDLALAAKDAGLVDPFRDRVGAPNESR